jgi:hypothetical protein
LANFHPAFANDGLLAHVGGTFHGKVFGDPAHLNDGLLSLINFASATFRESLPGS